MTSLKVLLLLLVLLLAAGGTYLYMGFYDVAADQPHYAVTEDFIDWVRERSIKAHALNVQVPGNLNDGERIRRGAGNYDAMCVHCHLSPDQDNTEIRKGLYPRPPDLTRHAHDPAEEFWIIKHGLKMTGMPAWGKAGVDDEAIWDMVALLQALPDMPKEVYETLVAGSKGHSHEGMEDGGHARPTPPAGEKLLEELPIRNKGHMEPGKITEPEDLPEDADETNEAADDEAETEDTGEQPHQHEHDGAEGKTP